MKRHPSSLATEIFTQYMETKERKTYLIVEGETDLNLWRDNFTNSDVIFKVSGDKEVSIETLKILYKELPNFFPVIGIIAIVDADFDFIRGDFFSHESLFRTDLHDINMMMLKSNAFNKFYNRYCTDKDRIRHQLKKVFKQNVDDKKIIDKIREYLFNNSKILGILRLINEIENLNLLFKKLNYYSFISKNSFDVEIDKLINNLITINKKDSKFYIKLYSKLQEELNSFDDNLIFQVCQGHDTISILTVGVNKFLSKRKQDSRLLSQDVHKFFEASFELYFLKDFQLYKRLKEWEMDNHPFKLFRNSI